MITKQYFENNITRDMSSVLNHGEIAKSLVYKRSIGTLSTISETPLGYPYGSLVIYAIFESNPIFLISTLAEHTKNLQLNPKASLMIADPEEDDPLSKARVTLVGKCFKISNKSLTNIRSIFLKSHPDSEKYIDFADFSFFKLDVSHVRFIGGFGKMSWLTIDQWTNAQPDPLVSFENDILNHMNEDHKDALLSISNTSSKYKDIENVKMVAVDKYGIDIKMFFNKSSEKIRFPFEMEACTPSQVRKELTKMIRTIKKRNS